MKDEFNLVPFPLPCPFCGSDDIYVGEDGSSGEGKFHAKCNSCNASSRSVGPEDIATAYILRYQEDTSQAMCRYVISFLWNNRAGCDSRGDIAMEAMGLIVSSHGEYYRHDGLAIRCVRCGSESKKERTLDRLEHIVLESETVCSDCDLVMDHFLTGAYDFEFAAETIIANAKAIAARKKQKTEN